MPKKCDFCQASASPEISVFKVTDDITDFLAINTDVRSAYRYICQQHFSADDMFSGSKRKKLRQDALPHIFENAMNVCINHSYSSKSKPEDPVQVEEEVILSGSESVLTLAKSSNGSLWATRRHVRGEREGYSY